MGDVAVGDKVRVARAVMDGFAVRDRERLVSLFTPDVEFRTRVDVTGETQFQGHDGARSWLASVDDKYDRFEIADATYRAGDGDAVFVSCRLRLRYAGDRYGMSRVAYWVIRVDESQGRVRAFTSFRDRSEALAAAGVSG